MKNNLQIIAFFSVAYCIPVYADGVVARPTGGQYGANRRVRTKASGFTAVKGTFMLPSKMFIPGVVRIDYDKPAFPSFPVTSFLVDNPSQSKPSFYLGCSNRQAGDSDDEFVYDGVEVDAGLQYEGPIKIDSGNSITFTKPGWGVFVRTTNVNGDPDGFSTNPAGGWRCGPGTKNPSVTSIDLTWSIYSNSNFGVSNGYGGYLLVHANGISEENQPVDKEQGGHKIYAKSGTNNSNPYTICRAYNAMRVKRVVAITQGGPYLRFPVGIWSGIYEEDGSFMNGCNFSNGQVSIQNPASYNSEISWLPWDSAVTDNNGNGSSDTGYYPEGRDRTIRSDDYSPNIVQNPAPFAFILGNATGSRPIFSFTNIPLLQWDANVSDRYATEDIDISLVGATSFSGSIVTPSSITPVP